MASIFKIISNLPYQVAHTLRDNMPWVWDVVQKINAYLFCIRYRKKIESLTVPIANLALPYRISAIRDVPTKELADFFQRQPADAFRWFRPHGFTQDDIAKLQNNKAFLAYVLRDEEKIVGYFFLRCFFTGKCYLGRMADKDCGGRGIGTLMNQISFYIVTALDAVSYQSIATENIASIKSCRKAYNLEPIRNVEEGVILYKNTPL